MSAWQVAVQSESAHINDFNMKLLDWNDIYVVYKFIKTLQNYLVRL